MVGSLIRKIRDVTNSCLSEKEQVDDILSIYFEQSSTNLIIVILELDYTTYSKFVLEFYNLPSQDSTIVTHSRNFTQFVGGTMLELAMYIQYQVWTRPCNIDATLLSLDTQILNHLFHDSTSNTSGYQNSTKLPRQGQGSTMITFV